jgi:xylulokinase
MGKELFLGIDLGTTGCKVLLLQADGRIVDQDYVDYPIYTPKAGFAEQDPEEWWNGLSGISRRLADRNRSLLSDIIGIGICGQMHTHVYLDKQQKVLRRAITWMDQRCEDEVAEIRSDPEKDRVIFGNTANFATTTYTCPKILWVKRHQGEIYEQTAKVLLAKDYIKYKLTGEMITDYSDAAGTLLFDVINRRWASEVFTLFGLRPSLMPEVAKSALVIGHLTREAALATGLPQGIPVINGAADHTAHALGAGVYQDTETTMQIGTSGAINVCSDRPIPDPLSRTACWNFCLEDKWVILGLTQTAGKSLDWFRHTFDENSDERVFQLYNRKTKEIPDGSEGLIYLPYLMGERCPHWNAKARGVFFGIDLKHTKYHFVKAIMEGVAFGLRENLEVIESLGIVPAGLKLLGGASNSETWKEIFAKILNKKIITTNVKETGARGSSLLCGLALGLYSSMEDVPKGPGEQEEVIFYPEMPAVYQRSFTLYKKLYRSIKDLYTL